MTPRRRQLCKPLARGSHCSLARKCLKDSRIRRYISKGFGCLLRKDIARLCSDGEGVFNNLTKLGWGDFIEQMKVKAPQLLELLQYCTKTKTRRVNQDAIIGVLASVLCKHRRPSASTLQRIVSLILYNGHASKKAS